jgi:hypothetical protein
MSGVKVFWGLLIVSLGITAGLWLFVREGVGPQPVGHIKLSSFVNAREASNAMFLKLRPQMLKSEVFFIGLPGNLAVGLDLVQQLQSDLPRYLESSFVFFIDQELEKLYPEIFRLLGQPVQIGRLATEVGLQELQSLVQGGLKVALITQLQTAYSEAPGLAQVWRDQGGLSFNLLLASLARSKEQESELFPPCRTGFESANPVANLGCMILQTSRLNYRRKAETKNFFGLMVQISDRDYLYLLRASEAT